MITECKVYYNLLHVEYIYIKIADDRKQKSEGKNI